MEVGPNVLGVWPEGESVQVKIGSVAILAFECMGDPKIDPNTDIVGSDIQSAMIEFDSFIGPAEMRKGGSNLIHEGVVGGVEIECSIEEVDGDLVLSLDEEEDGQARLDGRDLTSSSESLGFIFAASSNAFISCSFICFIYSTL